MNAGQDTKASKELTYPSEAHYRQFLETPPHVSLLEVEDNYCD